MHISTTYIANKKNNKLMFESKFGACFQHIDKWQHMNKWVDCKCCNYQKLKTVHILVIELIILSSIISLNSAHTPVRE